MSCKAPENLATMRHAALNLLRQDRQSKGSFNTKRKLAPWEQDDCKVVIATCHSERSEESYPQRRDPSLRAGR